MPFECHLPHFFHLEPSATICKGQEDNTATKQPQAVTWSCCRKREGLCSPVVIKYGLDRLFFAFHLDT